MKICVLGGGISGCSLAYLLKQRGHKITIYEKLDKVGGLCREETFSNGVKFHPFGPHIFHTDRPDVINFMKGLDVEIVPRKPKIKSYVEGKLVDYPINLETTIPELKDKEKILDELQQIKFAKEVVGKSSLVPSIPNNFKEQVEQMMGPTLYDTFIRDYTKKQWGVKPQNLDTSFAPKRIFLNEKAGATLFKDPVQGYVNFNKMFSKMTKGINVLTNREFNKHKHFMQLKNDYDLVISTLPIDFVFDQLGMKLKYRQMVWTHVPMSKTVYDGYMCVNYPTIETPFTRIAEMKQLTGQKCEQSLLTLEIPGPSINEQHYPFPDVENEEVFQKYLRIACAENNFITFGRLGLFTYIDMDDAIQLSIDSVDFIEKYKNLSIQERFDFYMNLRKKGRQ